MNDDYEDAVELQKLKQGLERMDLKPARTFGPADETCPDCGGPIETLLNEQGRDPWRCCFRCEAEKTDRT
jgi:hypothetical protein